MKYFVLLLAIVGSLQAQQTVQILRCVNTAIDAVGEEAGSNALGWLEWVADARETANNLIEHKRRCDSLPRNEPTPSLIQQRLIDACEAALKASVAIETTRLGLQLRRLGVQSDQIINDFQEQFAECFNYEL